MNNEINLLPGKTKQTAAVLRKRQTLHIIAVGSLFVVSFFSVILFILIALSPLPSLRQREKDETKRLSFYNEMIVKLAFTKDRITQINKILKSRLIYSESIESVRKLVPQNAAIEEVHLDNKTVLITVTSGSLLPLDQFIESVLRYNAESKAFKKVALVTLLEDFEKGEYILTLELI